MTGPVKSLSDILHNASSIEKYIKNLKGDFSKNELSVIEKIVLNELKKNSSLPEINKVLAAINFSIKKIEIHPQLSQLSKKVSALYKGVKIDGLIKLFQYETLPLFKKELKLLKLEVDELLKMTKICAKLNQKLFFQEVNLFKEKGLKEEHFLSLAIEMASKIETAEVFLKNSKSFEFSSDNQKRVAHFFLKTSPHLLLDVLKSFEKLTSEDKEKILEKHLIKLACIAIPTQDLVKQLPKSLQNERWVILAEVSDFIKGFLKDSNHFLSKKYKEHFKENYPNFKPLDNYKLNALVFLAEKFYGLKLNEECLKILESLTTLQLSSAILEVAIEAFFKIKKENFEFNPKIAVYMLYPIKWSIEQKDTSSLESLKQTLLNPSSKIHNKNSNHINMIGARWIDLCRVLDKKSSLKPKIKIEMLNELAHTLTDIKKFEKARTDLLKAVRSE